MRVLGIDPGLTRMGFGVVDGSGGRLTHVSSGVLSTRPDGERARRLADLYLRLSELIKDLRPDAIAVERVFFKLNARTAVGVIQSSGVALVAAAMSGASVYEYSPLEVKQSVVGTGSASKDQVRYMVGKLLALRGDLEVDAADALGLGICHLNSRRLRTLQELA